MRLNKKEYYILFLAAAFLIITIYWYSKYRIAPDIVSQNFYITDKENHIVPFSSMYGQNVFVVFFASWCGPCMKEMQQLEAVKNKLDTDEFRYIALTDESFDKIERFVMHTKSSFEFYRTMTPVKQIGIYTFPTIFLINQKGEIVFSHTGNYSWKSPDVVERFSSMVE
jgi:thiol-disulfide isomerase/thioredoxin